MSYEDGMTREQHLQWCKSRAFEYLDQGNIPLAMASFSTDMSKHRETMGNIEMVEGMQRFVEGQLTTPADMRKYIEGVK